MIKPLVTPPGVYLHHNGGRYTVLRTARMSTNTPPGISEEMLIKFARHLEGRRYVVYVSHTTGDVCLRDESEFNECVTWEDGSLHPRFELEK